MHKEPSVPDALLGAAAFSSGMLGVGNHRTALVVELDEKQWNNEYVKERLTRLATSINRPDTIKCDLFTRWGDTIVPGFGTQISNNVPSISYDEWYSAVQGAKYVLIANITVVPPKG